MYKVPFRYLPGFSKYDNAKFEHLFFENITAANQYERFTERVFNAIENKSFLPVMRMCDGEYIYCVGRKAGHSQSILQKAKAFAAKFLKTQVTSWGETYSRKQNKELKRRFPFLLKSIASTGFIANHFMYTPSHFCEEYIEPMQKWYSKNNIELTDNNSTAFYFVYVLLNGPHSLRLFQNNSILVISSFQHLKKKAVESELLRRGAKQVFFETISSSQSMLDQLDINAYKNQVQVVLIAGGIGSANILTQCAILNTVCIDSGFCLECIADASKKTERIFCEPDNDF